MCATKKTNSVIEGKRCRLQKQQQQQHEGQQLPWTNWRYLNDQCVRQLTEREREREREWMNEKKLVQRVANSAFLNVGQAKMNGQSEIVFKTIPSSRVFFYIRPSSLSLSLSSVSLPLFRGPMKRTHQNMKKNRLTDIIFKNTHRQSDRQQIQKTRTNCCFNRSKRLVCSVSAPGTNKNIKENIKRE